MSSRPIRVLHVCDKFSLDGSSIHGVSRLFSWWFPRYDKSRFDVRLVGLRKRDAAGALLEQGGIDVIHLGKGKFDPSTLGALRRVIRAFDADILHLHGYGAATFGRIAARLHNRPAIVHEHFVDPAMPAYQGYAEAALAPLTSYAIAVAESVKKFCIEKRRMPPDRIGVIYNGIPLEEFRPAAPERVRALREELGIREGEAVVGAVGRLHRQKGFVYLIQAMARVLAEHPRTRLVIVGDGALRDELERAAVDAGVREAVVFAGFRPKVAEMLSVFDIMAIPSLYEGVPLTVFEALAQAKAIVSTGVDGLGEVLKDGETALLVPPADSEALAAGIGRLLADPDRAAALRRRCEVERTRFEVQSAVDQMQSLYERLAANPRGAPI